jgi:hypothetical protein
MSISKVRSAGTAGVLALILLVGAALGAEAYTNSKSGGVSGSGVQSVSSGSSESAAVLTGKEDTYIFKDCGGYVGIVDSSGGQVITDISVAGLRAADRALLVEGIEVRGIAELTRLMEDLGS